MANLAFPGVPHTDSSDTTSSRQAFFVPGTTSRTSSLKSPPAAPMSMRCGPRTFGSSATSLNGARSREMRSFAIRTFAVKRSSVSVLRSKPAWTYTCDTTASAGTRNAMYPPTRSPVLPFHAVSARPSTRSSGRSRGLSTRDETATSAGVVWSSSTSAPASSTGASASITRCSFWTGVFLHATSAQAPRTIVPSEVPTHGKLAE